MNERLEIEVVAHCPECGCCFADWIPLDIDYSFLFQDLSNQTKKSGGVIRI